MSFSGRTPSLIGQISHRLQTQQVYVCVHCHHRALVYSKKTATAPLITRTVRRNSSSDESIPFTEKIRRKIWGTDNPPGPKDPYRTSILGEKGNLPPETTSARTTPTLGTPSKEQIKASDYVPATTWDGLDRIGGATGWWEEDWDKNHQFTSFLSREKARSSTTDIVQSVVGRAFAEVFVLKEAKKPLGDATNHLPLEDWNFDSIKYSRAENGSISFTFDDPEIRQCILDSTTTNEPPANEREDEAVVSSEVTEDNLVAESIAPEDEIFFDKPSTNEATWSSPQTAWEKSWLDTSIREPALKLAVIKRVMQLAGTRVPDNIINNIETIGDVVDHLTQKPKSKKLAQTLMSMDDLIGLPNIQIFHRRHTPIDKEKEIGRWKVIERELQDRRLPVTGTA